MKRNISLGLFLSFAPLSVVLSLTACNNNLQPRQDVSISIDSLNKTKYVYKLRDEQKLFAEYNFNLENFVGVEEIEFEITSQEEKGVQTDKIRFENGQTKITTKINNQQKNVILNIGPQEDETLLTWLPTYFNIAIKANIKWEKETFKTFNFEDIVLVVGKPTTSDLFEMHKSNDEIILDGFSTDSSKQEEIQKCNVLVIPHNVSRIEDFAFFRNHESTITHSYSYLLFSGDMIGVDSKLTSIGNCAFRQAGFHGILHIPNGVTEIGDYAFADTQFEHLRLPQSLTKIHDFAFSGCSLITGNLEIPKNVDYIGICAFADCYGLGGELIFEGAVSHVQQQAFKNCYSFKKIDFTSYLYYPQWLVKSMNQAFEGWFSIGTAYVSSEEAIWIQHLSTCNSLPSTWVVRNVNDKNIPDNYFIYSEDRTKILGIKEGLDLTPYNTISIPIGVTVIGDNAFEKCFMSGSSITQVNLFNGSLHQIGDNAFNKCDALTGPIVIPEGVVRIGEKSFQDCSNITSITIPSSVDYIGDYAFWRCTKIEYIDMHAYTILPYWISAEIPGIFNGLPPYGRVNISSRLNPSEVRSLLTKKDLNVLNWYVWDEGKVAPDTIFELSSNQKTLLDIKNFELLDGCRTIIIPPSVETIAPDAFNHDEIRQSSIKNINLYLPRLELIGARAFYNCYNFTAELNFPDSLTCIGDDAFNGCKNIKYTRFRKNLDIIGPKAFANCTSLVEIHAEEYESVPEWLNEIESHIFQNIFTKGWFYLNDNISYKDTNNIEELLTNNCDLPIWWIRCAESRVLPESCYELSGDKKTLLRIKEPEQIDLQYFYAKLPDSVVVLGTKSLGNLSYYSRLEAIDLFNGSLQKIENQAAVGATYFQDIIIPPYVEYIGEKAFAGCQFGYNLWILGSPKIKEQAFLDLIAPPTKTYPGPTMYLGGYQTVPECFKAEENNIFCFTHSPTTEWYGTVYVANKSLEDEFSKYLFGFDGKEYCNLWETRWSISSMDELWKK